MIFHNKTHQKYSECKIIGMLHGRLTNAEFSLQSASHNSRIYNQRQSWSQIREK